jgi:O-antigen ligase
VIVLGLAILALLLRLRASSARMFILCLLVIGGISGFWLRYQAYFERGATSISARFDYWKVALGNIRERPVLGSGPGTFMNVYRRMKSPEAEMTRLVHNDYLEQATDSGIVGALLFGTLIAGSLVFGYRAVEGGWVHFGVWLGVVGMAVQSFSEFGLYIPALAWPWFLAMGALVGRVPDLKTVDKGSGSS